MQALSGDPSKRWVSWFYILERHLTTTPKPVPTNASFPDLRTLLAIEGGKLLVSVLRDMISDKVSGCTSSEFCTYKSLTSNSRLLLCLRLRLKGFHLRP